MAILNPELPYVGELDGGLYPGKMVKIQGRVPSEATRFAINYQLGPGLNPRDDVAIHVSPRFREGFVTRNHIQSMSWGPEENHGPMWIQPGSAFEIIILCERPGFKIAINGRHFADFAHRLPYQYVTHLTIDGEVEISSIFFETIPLPDTVAPPDMPPVDVGPPPPGGLYPTLNPQEKYGPPPGAGGYGPPPHGYQPQQQKSEEEGDDFMDKVGLAVGGLVTAGGIAAAMHAYNKSKSKNADEVEHERSEAKDSESGLGGLGALGAALASSLASNALDRNAHAQQGYPAPDNMLGSLLGALGGGGHGGGGGGSQPQADPLGGALGSILGGLSGGHRGGGGGGNSQPQADPLAGALGSILGGLSGGHHGGGGGNSQPQADPLGGALGSILGGVLGGGSSHQQQPQYQPSGGYGNYQQNQTSQDNGGGDLISGLGNALFKSLTKHSNRSHHDEPSYEGGGGGGHYSAPPAYHETPRNPPTPPSSGKPKLTAAEISKGLGLSDDED